MNRTEYEKIGELIELHDQQRKLSHYIVNLNSPITSKLLSSGEKLTYVFLERFCHEFGCCVLTTKELSELIGVSVVQMRRYLSKLRELEYIFVDVDNCHVRSILIADMYKDNKKKTGRGKKHE